MAYYDALKAEWPSIPGATTAAKLTALNALTVAGEAPAIVWAPGNELRNAIVAADLATLSTQQTGWLAFAWGTDPVDITSGSLAYTAAVSLFAGKTTTLNQLGVIYTKYSAAPQIPWWQANGYLRAFDLGDIAEAGLS